MTLLPALSCPLLRLLQRNCYCFALLVHLWFRLLGLPPQLLLRSPRLLLCARLPWLRQPRRLLCPPAKGPGCHRRPRRRRCGRLLCNLLRPLLAWPLELRELRRPRPAWLRRRLVLRERPNWCCHRCRGRLLGVAVHLLGRLSLLALGHALGLLLLPLALRLLRCVLLPFALPPALQHRIPSAALHLLALSGDALLCGDLALVRASQLQTVRELAIAATALLTLSCLG
mmetsp:Transcript_87782/g.243469  ORF Transcript_87782/g.243469 Transcript_87782/m.243469 type:complete len:228 (+) Transcript_87782:1695-2378(+)